MKHLIVILFLKMVVLPDLGAVTGALDSISPEALVDLIDNPDGTCTIIWREEEDG